MKISTDLINFIDISVGSSEELFFTIENCAAWDQNFQIERASERSEFKIFPTTGLLLAGSKIAGSTLKISVIFQPIVTSISGRGSRTQPVSHLGSNVAHHLVKQRFTFFTNTEFKLNLFCNYSRESCA
ncbi:uncharacterized protein LOC122504250 [Leptopilina heterotoma]|uniref:uncharacterized protein LOC122504250 n=1 Tax=Leptopilina heterotoma TaxID=63436 RepID=UPI001CA7EEA4|nr:uncharacterized protein LOC122504250 [Leptopilina heterotoma]